MGEALKDFMSNSSCKNLVLYVNMSVAGLNHCSSKRLMLIKPRGRPKGASSTLLQFHRKKIPDSYELPGNMCVLPEDRVRICY